jgi:hypothetical protein
MLLLTASYLYQVGWSEMLMLGLWQNPAWEGLAVNPRTADTTTVRLAMYNSWFAVGKGEQEKGYPECMPAYVKHTGGIPFDQVKHSMGLRTGAHHLWIETGRWLNPR